MKAVIQRVTKASVEVENKKISEINIGLVILLGITQDDNQEDVEWLANKIVNLRIFDDEEGIMNKSIIEINGEILTVSQFTLLARTKKGNRPSYIEAANSDKANVMYEEFIKKIELNLKKKTKKGKFQTHMKVELINDGPVTIIIDTKDKK
ncbi:MAG: D-tyrosyl-tRNA(Tyr) deacylase [Bacteroidales bacterium]|jgi:D-tyrosyl-tRNA(Tyr) deacylase|nr:D-tyrosyl-tRNA(Tyr) deacylase [Bacteroidales bacterium]